jgi:predicted thioredoxin/glutaredoxin
MGAPVIEVFVEQTCQACRAVLGLVEAVSRRLGCRATVFTREQDNETFRARRVLITPATFINGRLAFYGEFSPAALEKKLSQS